MMHKFRARAYATSEHNMMRLQNYFAKGELAYYSTAEDLLAGCIWMGSMNREAAPNDWIYFGEMEISLIPAPEHEVLENMVASLRNQIKDTRAEAENKITQMTKRLNELLAITM